MMEKESLSLDSSPMLTARTYTVGGSDEDGLDGTSDLIANLDHDIPEIRVRALKCLHRKLDLGLVYGQRLAKRVDLFQRLASWLRSNKWTEEELTLILQFLSEMCQREEFRKNFMNTPLDSLLAKARLRVKADTRNKIDRLMDSVQSFDIYCEGPAEGWQDNMSAPVRSSARSVTRSCSALVSPRSKLKSVSLPSTQGPKSPSPLVDINSTMDIDLGHGQGEAPPEPITDVYYFANTNRSKDEPWIRALEVGIPTVALDTTDRRVLSSTIESLLSKNERLVMITICFVRDVLLSDFPAETFVQESSLCSSILQVVEEPWEDRRINYAAFQALLKLSNSLQSRLGYMDSSEFYQHPEQKNPSSSRSQSHYESGYSPVVISQLGASTEYFLNNLFQLLKGISRALTFKFENVYLWILMDSYSSTLHRYIAVFTGNPKTLYINLEEILLDLSHCLLRNPDVVNPSTVAIIMSSLLACFQEKNDLTLTKDVRRAIWSLGANAKLGRDSCAFILRHFLAQALPFEQGLDKARELQPNEFTMDNYSSWWKMDVVSGQRARGGSSEVHQDSTASQLEPEDIIPRTTVSIQNAVEHNQVVDGIEVLWANLLPLLLNSRIQEEDIDRLVIPLNSEWREAFYRFLSVEPTSVEDEDLLVRVLDLMSFLLKCTKNSEKLRKWVIPLVVEKGSAMLRILLQHCALKGGSSAAIGGTTLPTIVRSVFDFYHVVVIQGSSSGELGEVMNTFASILKALGQDGFSSPAILHAVLHGLAHLTCEKPIADKLTEDRELTVSLVNLTCAAIQAMGERAGDSSHRNRGSIHYGIMLLLHLSLVLSKEENWEWVGPSIPILPYLWIIENPIIRAATLQTCGLITASQKGRMFLLSELETPTLLWSYAYTRLTDPEETPIVRQKAGQVIINLINGWEEMKTVTGNDLVIPKWQLLEDLLGLLPYVYWNPKISTELRKYEDQENRVRRDGSGDAPDSVPLITPKVLTVVGRLISAIITHQPAESVQNFQNNELLFRDTCITLSRTIGKHKIGNNMEGIWWIDCCGALASAVQALISVIQLDRSLSLIIISDRLNLSAAVRLLGLIPPEGKSMETVMELWKNVLSLMTTLCTDAGNNFEDLERGLWIHRNVIFPRLVDWLDTKVSGKYRKAAVEYVNTFLSIAYEKDSEDPRPPFLCQVWKPPGLTYGMGLCERFLELLGESLGVEERISVLQCLDNLLRLSPTAKAHSLQHNVIKRLFRSLREFGKKSIESSSLQGNRKNCRDQEQLKWTLITLTTLFHESAEARQLGLAKHFADTVHTILKFANVLSDNRVLLHSVLETIINFTDGFPPGSYSLTLTSGMLGIPSRKIATPNSLYTELLGLLQVELDSIDKSPNLKTIELLMALLKNSVFSTECRNMLLKVKILNFIKRLHATEIKKWGHKFPAVKQSFLQFLVQLTVYPDMQSYIAKIDESLEVFILLSENEALPCSLLALQILRNISFQSGNRARLLYDTRYMSGLAARLKHSESLEELECVGVALWAVTANCEKGKVAAKRLGCVASLNLAIQRLRKKETSVKGRGVAEEKPRLSAVITLLDKVASVQSSSSVGSSGDPDFDTYRDTLP